MNKQLLEYVKMLSLLDKKSLSEKALKVSEECGELAKVVLPYDNADGTTHRFIEKERILEEAIDTILAAISIPFSLDFTDEEIIGMFQRKAKKWQGIQSKEEKVDYPIPYEIHITIQITTDERHLNMFKEACADLGVKPIVLDLENNGEVVMKDVMTSSKHIGNNTSAYIESQRIVGGLIGKGYNFVRAKIETVPWHPAAPTEEGDIMPKDCYFEAHVGCIITPEQKDLLEYVTKNHDAHLSRNFFKKLEDGKFINMITLRNYDGTYYQFCHDLDALLNSLHAEKIEYEKVITEFSIYDTKVSHDYQWLEKKELV